MSFDAKTYMQLAIDLAQKGLGQVKSNPLVGAVVVCNDKVIGRGFHEKYGEAHAEVNAINSVEDKSLLAQSTLYVTLEPCAHQGKTPPCASLIVAHQIPRVVVGQQDPNPKVNGKGIEFLRANGVEVVIGIEEKACRWMNRRFNAHFEKQRPYIILKWAQSADGFIDPARTNGEKGSIAISSAASRYLVQQWRKEEMAILVGRRTVSVDNPRLTFHADNSQSPIRFVIDPQLQLQPYTQYHIGHCPPNTVVVCKDNQHIDQLPEGMTALPYSNHAIEIILQYCFVNGITSILVEGGGHTLQTFIDQNCWDEARIFESPQLLGQGTAAPVWKAESHELQNIGDDQLKIYYR